MFSSQKVGVLTFHRSINYGSYWQAWCLVETLKARGYAVELLDHDCSCIRRSEFRCALQPELPRRTPPQFVGSYATKARKFLRAIAALPLSRRFSVHEPAQAGSYDAIVVGSDEVWNFRHPWFGSKPIFFGDELKTSRLVSFAASFGNYSASCGIHPDWARKLNRFAALSVRDENSAQLVRNATGGEAQTVLDPCLQFPEIPVERAPVDGRYAVIYGHGFPAWLKRQVRRWADRRGIRLVSIGYFNDFADEQLIRAGPLGFAEMMANARAVVTNFFHGCVFAILNGKPWATCPSGYRSIKISDLVTLLGSEQRIIGERTSEARIDELLGTPIQAAVASKIAQLRHRSDAYLDAALS